MQCANSVTFRLLTFLMVSSFKEKFKNQTSKAVLKNKCIRFYPNLPPKSRSINPLSFRKIMWLLVEHCITNTFFTSWNGIAPGYIHDMLKPSSLLRYTILKASCITDGIILTSAENNYMSKKAIFLRAKNMVRNKPQKKKS